MAQTVSPALNGTGFGFFLESAVQVDIDPAMDDRSPDRPSTFPRIALSVFHRGLVTDDFWEQFCHLRAAGEAPREEENEQQGFKSFHLN